MRLEGDKKPAVHLRAGAKTCVSDLSLTQKRYLYPLWYHKETVKHLACFSQSNGKILTLTQTELHSSAWPVGTCWRWCWGKASPPSSRRAKYRIPLKEVLTCKSHHNKSGLIQISSSPPFYCIFHFSCMLWASGREKNSFFQISQSWEQFSHRRSNALCTGMISFLLLLLLSLAQPPVSISIRLVCLVFSVWLRRRVGKDERVSVRRYSMQNSAI